MKKNYKQCKTRFLLFFLLSLFAGGLSPAWADEAVTESFEYASDGTTAISISEDAKTLSNGWTVVGLGSSAGIATSGWSKTLKLQTSGARSGNCIYAGGNSAVYIVCPVEVSGTLSFYWKRNDGSGTLKIYAAEKDEDTYTIGSLLATADKTTATNTSSYFEFSTDLGSDPIYVAFLLNYAYLDDVTYTPYIDDGSLKKPKALAVNDVTASSAVLSWTAGGTETAWEVSYSTTSGNPDNGTIVSANETTYTLTGLTAETTYYAAVRAKDGEDVSSWTSEVSFTPSRSVQLTVNDGTTTNSYVPIYGNYVDAFDKAEFIIPAEELAVMANSDIKALTFYLSSPASTSWGNANFKIYMTEVENTTVSSYTFNDNDFTALYSGSLDGTKSEMAITLTTPYSYGGGNLLVGVYNTAKGTYKSASFYGVSAESGASAYGYSTSSLASVTSVTKQSFLPKTTFTYLPVDGAVMKVSETAFDFGTITAESTVEEKTKTFTISNKGNATLENISVAYTGDDVFTLSDGIATSIAEGGDDITVTVTMNTSTPGDYSGTITVSATDQTPVEISVVGTYAANPATMAISLGEEAVGEIVAFGNVGKQNTKTFTVTNSGNLSLNITSITSSNTTDFIVSPSTLTVPGGSSETFTVTFVWDGEELDEEKTATITLTASNEGLAPQSFMVTGTRIEQWSEDFSAGTLPDGWEITNGTYWKVQDNMLKGSYSYGNFDLITPSLIVEAGQTMTFDYRMTSTYRSLDIQYSKNNGAWTNLATISYSGLTQNQWYTYTIEGLDEGSYKFRFGDSNYDLDNFQGFKRNLNDPKMGAYTDAECTVAAASSVTKDFGFVTEDATYTYYIKNDGTGTLTLDQDEVPAGFSAVLGKSELAKDESTSLTITFGQISGGYRGGNIVVNGNDGSSFTVAVSGVMVDNSKLNLNFATDNIPSNWTATNWTKNASGYIENSTYSSGSIATVDLTATDNEELVIEAKMFSTSYTFGVNYKKSGDTDWSPLIAASNIGTNWTLLHTTIAEAGSYQLQLVGTRAQIRHIYGLTEPQEAVMAVYDGESLAGASYDFGNVANDADAIHTFTIKNEGNAALTGVTATLSGDQASHYSVEISGLTDGNIAGKSEATLTVTQLKDNLGAHAATLTISSTDESIADIVIELSGVTRDASKMYVDFADGIPATWTANGSWTTSSGYAQAPWSGNATLTSPALTIAAGENLTVDLSKQYNNNNAVLTFRYTTDGGVTWSEQDLSSDLTYGEFTTKTLSLGNTEAVTAFIQFVGTYYARIDNICGGVATTAPLFALTTSEVLTDGKYDFGQSLQEAPADKVFTITNNGNADLVSDIAANDDVEIALSGDDVTINGSQVTVPAGKSATMTVSLKFNAANPGAKTGNVTIDSNDPVADVELNFTANVLDPTVVNYDFSDNSKPAGWYNSGFSFANGAATINSNTEATLITEKLTVSGPDDVLSYDAGVSSSWASSYASLAVSYSTDRLNWIALETQPTLSTTAATFNVQGLEAGEYYLQFKGTYVTIDNISGWHKVTGIDHDLFFVSIDVPEGSYVPGSDYTATVKVANLRAESETVTAELFIKNEQAGVPTEKVIALDETKEFTLTGIVPEEGKHLAWVKVYNSDITIQTEPVTFTSAHNRTLEITEFTCTSEASVAADDENKFTATFDVKVKNTGSADLTADQVLVTITDAEGNPYQSANATESLAVNGETTIAVTVTTSALEGGAFIFKAQEEVSGTVFATTQTVTVTAAAPKFALYQDATPVNDGDDVDFGLVKGTTETFDYTIKNEGTANLELVSIVAPTGFTVTPAITDDNKNIAVDKTLAISVTMGAEEGKKSGNLVFTYQVDATTQMTFTLALSGRSVAADTWTEDFATEIPASWTNNGWEWNDDRKAAYSGYSKGHELMTPRLAAEEGEELNFDVIFPYGNEQLKVQYSTDKTNWNDVSTYVSTANNQTFEGSFIAPATGNYYLKFGDSNSRYVYVDNFVGFRLNIPEHDIEIAASNIPTTGTQYAVYTASVTLQENAGKAEEVTAKLIVNGEEKDTENETLTANGQTVITLTWTSEEVIAEAVKAKITVTGTEIDLTTEEVDLTIAEPYTLDETSSDAVVNGTYEVLVLNRSWVAGFNTVCLPFETTAEEIFGTGAIAYEFAGLIDNELRFTEVESMSVGVPYLVEAKAASTDDTKMHILRDVTISSLYTTPDKTKVGDITFWGTYAPMAAGTMEGLWGVTPNPSIAKGTAGASMKGFRAYFTGLSDAGVKGFRFEGDTATGVRYVKMSADEIRDIFDLGGRKLNETRKGINIVNGKKVLVK